MSDAIRQFLFHYSREFDFFAEASRIVAYEIETELTRRGIRAIVSHRAKNPDRLKRKLEERSSRKINPKIYATVEDIYTDIVDLAGVRIALYFPGDQEKVKDLLGQTFDIPEPVRKFPDSDAKPRSKNLAGYLAWHYRVKLRQESLEGPQKRYGGIRVEVQVASVLMHAWAEVEHDLLYKSLQGEASQDERAILDELNGMVLAGEIALERLQRSVEARVGNLDSQFSNEFELESFLSSKFPSRGIGRVDFLMDLLRHSHLNSPRSLQPYLERVGNDGEVADKLIDLITSDDPDRYSFFNSIWTKFKEQLSKYAFDETPDEQNALGAFLAKWIEIERRLKQLAGIKQQPTTGKTIRHLLNDIQVDSQTRDDILGLWRERNQVVHGVGLPSARALKYQTERLDEILRTKLIPPQGNAP